MAPKRPAPPPPPSAFDASSDSSSDEGDEEEEVVAPAAAREEKGDESSSEESESESEEAAAAVATTKSPAPPTPISHPKAASESESESESDSESEPNSKPAPALSSPKPTKKPTTEPDKKKQRLSPSPSPSASGGGKPKKFQRLWTPEDEVALLRALAHAKHSGVLPTTDNLAGSLRKYLTFECSRSQVYEKVRRLKKRYDAAIVKHNNGRPLPKRAHDRDVFELSDKVWGGERISKKDEESDGEDAAAKHHPKVEVSGAPAGTAMSSKAAKKRPSKVEVNGPPVFTAVPINAFASRYPYLAEEVDEIERTHTCGKTLKRVLTLMDEDSAAGLDAKIRQQRIQEIEMQILRSELTNKVVQKLVKLTKKD